MLTESSQPKKSKRQLREEQASMDEIARIKAQEEVEAARVAEIEAKDAEIARKMQEGLEPSEGQKKRMSRVQQAAKFYTKDEWDLIGAKLEVNRDILPDIKGEEFS